MKLHITRGLELLEDNLVHLRAGIDERCGQDRKRSAMLDISGSTEEPLGHLHRVGVDTTGKDLAGMRHLGIICPGQPRDRIEQDHNIFAVLDHPLGLFDHHLGDLAMTRRRLVKRRTDNLDIVRGLALHIGYFLRPLVDQQHDHLDLRMIDAYRIGDLLQKNRLTRPRRSHDQTTLALADRRNQVDHARAEFLGCRLQNKPLLGVKRSKIAEYHLFRKTIRLLIVDRLYTKQCEILLALLRGADLARYAVAAAQSESTDLRRRNVNIVRRREVIVIRAPQETEPVRQNLENAVAVHQAVLLDALFEYLKDQLLLRQTHVVLNAFLLGQLMQITGLEILQVLQVQIALLDPLVLGMDGLFLQLLLALALCLAIGRSIFSRCTADLFLFDLLGLLGLLSLSAGLFSTFLRLLFFAVFRSCLSHNYSFFFPAGPPADWKTSFDPTALITTVGVKELSSG